MFAFQKPHGIESMVGVRRVLKRSVSKLVNFAEGSNARCIRAFMRVSTYCPASISFREEVRYKIFKSNRSRQLILIPLAACYNFCKRIFVE